MKAKKQTTERTIYDGRLPILFQEDSRQGNAENPLKMRKWRPSAFGKPEENLQVYKNRLARNLSPGKVISPPQAFPRKESNFNSVLKVAGMNSEM